MIVTISNADGLSEEWKQPMHWAGFLAIGASTFLPRDTPSAVGGGRGKEWGEGSGVSGMGEKKASDQPQEASAQPHLKGFLEYLRYVHVCVHIYMYMNIYMYVYIYMCVYIPIYLYICMYTCTQTHTHTCIYI